MRLQKYIASCGVTSRRKAEELISTGRISVNGQKVTEMGILVSDEDRVALDGKLIAPEEIKHYILFNKPEGIITTASDEFGRKTVLDYFKDISERIYTVGRLDYDTSGLLILTNDGEFANYMSHPSNQIGKTYIVACNEIPDEKSLQRLRSGISIDGYVTGRARVSYYKGPGNWTLRITIYEGRNRQVRKMLEAVGYRVSALRRIGIGNIHDNRLAEGTWRNLTAAEIRDLGFKVS